MTNEQAIAELQALKGAPGFQQHWQERVQKIIDHLSAPVMPPTEIKAPEPGWEGDTEQSFPDHKAKHKEMPAAHVPQASKVTTAAHVTPAKTKGKK